MGWITKRLYQELLRRDGVVTIQYKVVDERGPESAGARSRGGSVC
ncbi:MAG: hypothetical protein U5K84_05320 [Alkalibacterium sp.]|nr:hypothetical protein [Alkalibacterium sp.]